LKRQFALDCGCSELGPKVRGSVADQRWISIET